MSGKKRSRTKRDRRIRVGFAIALLGMALVVFIFMLRSMRDYGVDSRVIVYGFVMIILFFLAGSILAPVIGRRKIGTRIQKKKAPTIEV